MSKNSDRSEESGEFKTGRMRRFLGFFGLRYPRKKEQWLLLTRRTRRILLGSLVVFLGAFFWFTFYYSNQPSFCKSCHIMEPYVASWEGSSHKGVVCKKCHFTPGLKGYVKAKADGFLEVLKYVTGNYGTIRQVEIEDASCLRSGCHETRLLEGKVTFLGKYSFDHKPHLTKLRRGKKLRCTSCHSQMVQGSHIKVTESVCFTCHFKEHMGGRSLDPLSGCTSCHAKPGEVVRADGTKFQHKPLLDRKVPCWKCHLDTVQGSADVPKQVCKACHAEPEKMEKFSDSTFMHDWHVTRRKVECFQCHGEIRHAMRPQPVVAGTTVCGTCHSAAHLGHSNMFAGTGAKGVEDIPSKHFLANVDCVACHEMQTVTHDGKVVDVATHRGSVTACVACHGESGKAKMEEITEVRDMMMEDAKIALAKARKAYDALPGTILPADKAQAEEALKEAQFNFDFVNKTFLTHNPDYGMAVLEKVGDDASKATRLAAEAKKKAQATSRPAGPATGPATKPSAATTRPAAGPAPAKGGTGSE